MKKLPKLDRVTAYTNEAYAGIARALPPSGAAFVIGLIHGMFDEAQATEHLRALDTLCRLHGDTYDRKTRLVVEYLREHDIGDYRPRRGFALVPE